MTKWKLRMSTAIIIALEAATSGGAANAQTVAPPPEDSVGVQDIVVTARKTSERLQDVPIPVTAVSGEVLSQRNQIRLQDYYTTVPGLNLVSAGVRPTIAIRGITTGPSTNPSVGVTIDDVPYGSSTSLGSLGLGAPDLDPSDLQRVEVLRGPQGTLYGAASIGGLLKYVTVDPSTEAVSGRLKAGLSTTRHGSDIGFELRGSVNLPINENVAIRASGFNRRDPGYIDDPLNGLSDVNDIKAFGGRLAVLLKLSPDVRVKVNALYQDTDLQGAPVVTIGQGRLQQNRLAGTGRSHQKAQFYSAVATADLGFATLTSITGYGLDRSYELQYQPGSYIQLIYPTSLAGSTQSHRKTRKASQELRLDGKIGAVADWLIGGFYTKEKSRSFDVQYANGLSVDDTLGLVYIDPFPTTYKELAAFGNVTLHLADRFDVQIGARQSENRQRYEETVTGPYSVVFAGVDTLINPPVKTKDSSFTFVASPQFKVSRDWMIYGRVASGYRPGGPNSLCLLVGVPCQFGPDKTINYELGTKGKLLDGKLSFDASIYYIDWKAIQIILTDPLTGSVYFANGNDAKSKGIELSFEARPWESLSISGWAAFNDAALKQPFPANGPFGLAGDRLPFASRHSASLSVDQEFPLGASIIGYAGGTISYVGNRLGVFTTSSARQAYPAYTQLDLRGGLKWNDWSVDLIATNITDKRALLSGGLGAAGPLELSVSRPRTLSLSIGRSF